MKANLLVRLLFFNNGLHKQQAVCIFILKIKRDAVKKKQALYSPSWLWSAGPNWSCRPLGIKKHASQALHRNIEPGLACQQESFALQECCRI